MASDPIRVQKPIRFGEDFEFDVSSRSLRRGGRVLKLERIPLEILVLLLEHWGEVVTRDEIVAKVWGKGVFLDTDNSIRGAIRKIRQVLKDDHEHPRFIQTITGRGYRFIAPILIREEENRAEASKGQPPTVLEGIPGDRHVHGKRGSVHAFPWELDVWRQSRSLPLDEEEEKCRAETPVHAEGTQAPSRTPQARRWLVLGGMAALVLLGATYIMTRSRAGDATGPQIKSLAVLPLKNLSGDPAQEYLVDGMTEALITDLAKISALRIISRTSVMQYKLAEKPLPQIGRELSVDAVVEGSVQRSGNRLRVTAQLIQASPERHLWGESYERDFRDVLALQSELARTIAGEIRVKVTPREETRLANMHPVNPASHEAYLKGLYYFNEGRDHIARKRGDESFQKSVDYLREAVQIDPDYAIAYAALARTYHWMASISIQGELAAESKVAARRALELDPTLAEAHGALAFVMFAFDHDWAGAEQEFRRAIELSPGYGEAHHGYALYLTMMGRLDEAIAETDKALLLDPLTLPQKRNAANIYACAGQYERGIEQLRTLLALNPKSFEAHFDLGRIYIQKGMFEQGIEEIQEGAKLTGGDVYSQRELALAYAASGRRGEASRLLNHVTEKSKAPVDIAAIYASLGDKSNAIAWLEKAAQRDPVDFGAMRCVESLKSLRGDPRVQEMFSHLGLLP
jgi:TolB-like protein/DNA-binding winged helix-turn-helix (wHTH) protein/Tfp pilus assembly protein PilF